MLEKLQVRDEMRWDESSISKQIWNIL